MRVNRQLGYSFLGRLPLDVLVYALSLTANDERRLLALRCLNRYFRDVCVPQLFTRPGVMYHQCHPLNAHLSQRLHFSRCLAQIRAHQYALRRIRFVNRRVRRNSLQYRLRPDIRNLCARAKEWVQWADINRQTSCWLTLYRALSCFSRDQLKRFTRPLLTVTLFLLVTMILSLFALSACRDLQLRSNITLVNESHIFIPFLSGIPVPHPKKCDIPMWLSGISVSLVSYFLCLLLFPLLVSLDVGSCFLARLRDKIHRQSNSIVAKNTDDVERAFSRFPYLQEPLLVSGDECGVVAECQP